MKGDFTRDTFQSGKHFRQALMQQGRVQLDADWNEQTAITAHRAETSTEDIAGHCGGPADAAAFGVLTAAQVAAAGLPAAGPDDFYLSAGRYYVDGIQCELEAPVLFTKQPDLPGQPLAAGVPHLLYLDVWTRHLTALEDPELLDPALGGIDTATRVKTVWQVRALKLDGGIPADACGARIAGYETILAPSTVRLSAETRSLKNVDDPCQVPETTGYKGLENQLYRVEIHEVNADGTGKSWKWSRENGSIVSRLLKIDKANKQITVESLGRGNLVDFAEGQFVEILDDLLEWQGLPGQLIEIATVNPDDHTITLKDAPEPLTMELSFPDGVITERHSKVSRWDGQAKVKQGALELEAGIQVKFADTKARCHTGDYWQIPARAATATAAGGDIEWPRELINEGQPDNTKPISIAPRGVVHHFCRLGFIALPAGGAAEYTDCRCLWPVLTAPRLIYVGGDGQEAMPDLSPAHARVQLQMPIVVAALNGQCHHGQVKARFLITIGEGVLMLNSSTDPVAAGPAPAAAGKEVMVAAPNGLLAVTWWLESNPAALAQRVKVELFDDADPAKRVVSGPIYFNATLSVASEVAYDPGDCQGLADQFNVQDAVERLASSVRLEKSGGDGQDAEPGAELSLPVKVAVMSKCGPVAGATVRFAVNGGGTVTATQDEGGGIYSCRWTLAASPPTQELTAILDAVPGNPAPLIETPKAVGFTANVRTSGHGACCCLTVGPGGDFATLEEALRTLIKKTFDLCLCLLAGDHRTEGGLELKTPAPGHTHLKITGCGPNTRLTLGGPMTIFAFTSVVVRDLVINAGGFGIGCEGCGSVEFSGCRFSGVTGESPLIGVSSVARLDLANNQIEATDERAERSTKKIFRTVDSLVELFAEPMHDKFAARLARTARELARMDAIAREEFVTVVTVALRQNPTLPGEEITAYRQVTRAMAVAEVNTAELMGALQAVRNATRLSVDGFAIQLGDMSGMVTLVENVIHGTIYVGGAFVTKPLSAGDQKRLVAFLREKPSAPLAEVGILQVHRNDLGRMTLGQAAINDLRSLFLGQIPSINVWQSAFFSHNIVQADGQFLVAGNLSMTANRFRSAEAVLGLSINNAAQYGFNRGDHRGDGQEMEFQNLSLPLGVIKEPNSGFKVTEL